MPTSARENTLQKIRDALRKPTSLPFPELSGEEVYARKGEDLKTVFADEFKAIQGNLICCENREEVALRLAEIADEKGWSQIFCQTTGLGFNSERRITQDNLALCDAAITDCEFLVARTGSIVLSSVQTSGRIVSVFTPIHLVVATTDQLVYDIKHGIAGLTEKYKGQLPSALFFASGPSRTGDIEKTLVMGVHGPIEVYVFLITT
jgi:L-lactate dehydrogenase complex protein LldG